jgi:hypothetical protein
MFGDIPADDFFIRHVKVIELSNVEVICVKEDLQPGFMVDDVKGAACAGRAVLRVKNVADFRVHQC